MNPNHGSPLRLEGSNKAHWSNTAAICASLHKICRYLLNQNLHRMLQYNEHLQLEAVHPAKETPSYHQFWRFSVSHLTARPLHEYHIVKLHKVKNVSGSSDYRTLRGAAVPSNVKFTFQAIFLLPCWLCGHVRSNGPISTKLGLHTCILCQ
jgi:hypothetical protein